MQFILKLEKQTDNRKTFVSRPETEYGTAVVKLEIY